MKALSHEENEKLKDFKVCVVGCGGLGGYIIESLGRIGIGYITAIDGDVFEESNLNRQLLSQEDTLGISKAQTAKNRMKNVNSTVNVTAVSEFITEQNSEQILKGHDIIVDALDNVKSRFVIEQTAQKLGIPLIHGAIAGWYGQVSVSLPGKPLYDKLYQKDTNKGIETELGNLPFTAAVTASVQAAEVIKVLLNRKGVLVGKLLTIDLLSQEYEVFDI
jgi:molybdopterin/thiamine biosynthesis adenylyltransferase